MSESSVTKVVKHTPGPWAVHPVYFVTASETTETGGFAVFTDDGRGNGLQIGYTEANARLIASAPDLLAALRCVDDYFTDSRGPAETYDALVALVKGAITRAEGAR